MAKKISKEMMEALKTAKSPEDVTKILEAEGFDIQELSLDDLEQVSGGFTLGNGAITINTEEELDWFVYDYIKNFEKSFGRDNTAKLLLELSGSQRFKEEYLAAGLDGLHNHIGLIMDHNGGYH